MDGVTSFVFEQMKSLVERRKNPSSGSSGEKTESGSSGHAGEGRQEGSADESDVTVLTDSSFDSVIKASNAIWLIEFYGK